MQRLAFVPARYRWAYLPRTPPFILEKSYSGRRSSAAVLAFFIISSFVWCCRPCVNDACLDPAVSMRNNNRLPPGGDTDRQEPSFTHRVVRIGKSPGQRISEYGGSFMKGNAVLSEIALLFLLIPLELEFHVVTLLRYGWILNQFSRRAGTTNLPPRPKREIEAKA